MASDSQIAQLLTFFKALADENRLKIIGILALERKSVEQLAALLHVRPSTISHHLSKLAAADLVFARAEGYYSVYQLEHGTLESMARMLSRDHFASLTTTIDLDAYDRQVIEDFSTPEGRLTSIPAQSPKREIIIRYLANSFIHGRSYPEAEVNEILSQFHDDTTTMRQALVSEKLLAHESGHYWRTIASGPPLG
jgi:hypothetical protein